MDTKIEQAKSWFILAQMLIILSGFCFAIMGVSYSSYVDAHYSLYKDLVSIQISANQFTLARLEGDPKELSDQLFSAYGTLIDSNQNLIKFSCIFGFILLAFGFCFWLAGHNLIKNKAKYSLKQLAPKTEVKEMSLGVLGIKIGIIAIIISFCFEIITRSSIFLDGISPNILTLFYVFAVTVLFYVLVKIKSPEK